MIRSNSVLSTVLLSVSILGATPAMAQRNDFSNVTIRDVTQEYAKVLPSIMPTPPPPGGSKPGGDLPVPPLPDLPSGSSGSAGGKIDISQIITIGEKVWDFIVNNKPTADVKTLKANVIPAGLASWTQLRWQKDKVTAKVYRVEFKNIFGGVGGSFDYRISFIYGGSYNGKGKFIGQIAVAPTNVNLKTDRSLTFRAELLDALNFGTEDDPVAGAQLLITWSTPTTTRYEMKSVEYFLYGDGEVQDLTNGQFQ
jgi:hypothetical protein